MLCCIVQLPLVAQQQQRVQRRLAAILAADVAGYRRLTGADEEGTLERLSALRREVIDPAITAQPARAGLRLVHRGFLHPGPQGGKGTAGGVELKCRIHLIDDRF
jgi:class 3 adenylate cyclase